MEPVHRRIAWYFIGLTQHLQNPWKFAQIPPRIANRPQNGGFAKISRKVGSGVGTRIPKVVK